MDPENPDEVLDVKLDGRQLAIMKLLWENGEATVAQLQSLLDTDPPLAYSTVATVLSRMAQKGLVAHRIQDRQFYYRSAISQDSAGRSMLGELVSRVFDGSPAELVSNLLESEHVDARELQRIKKLVQQYESRCQKRSRSKP
jgi:predicted transcriptional regulator